MRACAAALFLLACAAAPEGRQDAPALGDALAAALKPALPFPEADADGTPPDGDSASGWTVRWPAPGSATVEVLANPLNPDNRARALKAEAAIQKAAMQSQQRSQADYDKAVSDFQKTGRTSEIREISLRDDGLAGERYDAESQATIEIHVIDVPHRITVATSRPPEAFSGRDGGPTAIVRVTANEYDEPGDGTAPGQPRFCAEQAWVFFGPVTRPVVSRTNEREAAISVPGLPDGGDGRMVVISVRGNVEIVDRVLQRADWARFASRLPG
jgi:hypothetical protein